MSAFHVAWDTLGHPAQVCAPQENMVLQVAGNPLLKLARIVQLVNTAQDMDKGLALLATLDMPPTFQEPCFNLPVLIISLLHNGTIRGLAREASQSWMIHGKMKMNFPSLILTFQAGP